MSESSLIRHRSRSPDVADLLKILETQDVRYVVIGSVAAAVYGVELQAADLDIVPDTDKANLRRLVDALQEMEAKLIGGFGSWAVLESGEKKWTPRPTTEQEIAEWIPDVDDLWTLDHLYATRFGDFDVAPEIGGTYDTLRPRACLRSCEGFDVWLAYIDELLARLTVPRREKDIPWVAALREIQREMGTGTH